MTKHYLLLTVASLAVTAPALAQTAPAASDAAISAKHSPDGKSAPAAKPAAKAADSDMVTTGVARGRDRLDSATSTSSLKETEIQKIGARSLADILRDIPGIRAENGAGETNNNYSIRGLPLSSSGAKFLQLQENGLPVLEFGDIAFFGADTFLRPDLNLAQVEAIRGGSASTFASNAPGGVINLIDKTGDVEGGSIQATAGLDYQQYRVDFDYGAKINDTLRFHVGGYYHQGEGVRHTGFDSRGGQLKFNLTKTFDGGFIRFYGKLLDDRTPIYLQYPLAVSGTDANPVYSNPANFVTGKDTLLSRYFPANLTLDGQNRVTSDKFSDGAHSVMKSFGVEASFDLHGWNIADKFRFEANSGSSLTNYMFTQLPAIALTAGGSKLSYANGPDAGQVIANPMTLNGNGLAALVVPWDVKLNSLDNVTNDLRASRVWTVGGGDLTTTAGFYKSSQTIAMDYMWTTVVSDVTGDGNSHLLNLTLANGLPVTQNGYLGYGSVKFPDNWKRSYDVNYGVSAPYASFNYHVGKLAVGGSVRYDYGTARGHIIGASYQTVDINGNGSIAIPERSVAVANLGSPMPVNYNWHYLSYSVGVNYRVAPSFSTFARYSRGGRANADRMLFGPAVSATDGSLIDKAAAVDFVRQAELGVKYRKSGLTLNLTAFWAKSTDHNLPATDRVYRTVGVEFEGGYRKGIFSLTAGATYTKAKIIADAFSAATVGNVPRHQASVIFQVTPQIETHKFNIGANVLGTTSSYAQDSDQLKLPGYTVVNAFVEYHPVDGLTLAINSNNLFNSLGITEMNEATLPATGYVGARTITGRTVSGSVRFDF